MGWFYAAWISFIVVLYAVVALVTKWANEEPTDTWRWVIILYALGFFGAWPIVAKFSKNVVFDALLYDIVMFFAFNVTLIILGCANKFTSLQWVGVFVVMAGYVLLKVGAK